MAENDCISQNPTAVVRLGHSPGTGRAGFYCFHRCYEERAREGGGYKSVRTGKTDDRRIQRERHTEACGGKLLTHVCVCVCGRTAGGLDRNLDCCHLFQVYFIQKIQTDSWQEPLQGDKKGWDVCSCCPLLWAVKWVNTWEGAEKSNRDWSSFVLLEELERGRDGLNRPEREWGMFLANENRHSWFVCFVSCVPNTLNCEALLNFIYMFLNTAILYLFRQFLTTLNWFYRLHMDQFN